VVIEKKSSFSIGADVVGAARLWWWFAYRVSVGVSKQEFFCL